MFPNDYFAAAYFEPDYWPPLAEESSAGVIIERRQATMARKHQDDRDLPILLAALFQRIFNQ